MTAARRIVVVSLIILTACTHGPTLGKETASHAIPRGGTLRVVVAYPDWPVSRPIPSGYTLDPDAFDPVAGPDFSGLELYRCCVARTLLSYNGQRTGMGGAELRPDLATSMPDVSADGLTWTFHLKSGLHYAPPLQRTEIVATDFIRSLERQARLNQQPLTFWFVIRGFDDFVAGKTSSIAGLESPDAHTLVVRLRQPSGDLGYRFASLLIIPIPGLPGDRSGASGVATGHEDGYGAFFVSSGPYMIEGSDRLDFGLPPPQQQPVSGLVPGRSLTLVRNPSWSAATDPLRPAYVDRR